MNEISKLSINTYDSFPSEWNNSPVLETVYSIVNYGEQLPTQDTILTVFKDAVVILYFGDLNYTSLQENLKYTNKGRGLLVEAKIEERKKEGAWLVIFTPLYNGDEHEAEKKASIVCGIYLALNGLAIAYNLEYTQQITVDRKISIVGAARLQPHAIRDVNISSTAIDLIAKIYNSIEKFEIKKKNRLLFSLHWYEKSFRSEKTDSFLNAWIALEALAIPEGSKIKPMQEKLSIIYKTSIDKLEIKFCTGLLCNLRGDIVHNGMTPLVHPIVMDHVRNIYVDLLIHECNLDPIFRSDNVFKDESLTIRKIILKNISTIKAVNVDK